MMSSFTRVMVLDKAQRLFDKEIVPEVLAALDGYRGQECEAERERVQLALLRLSNGKVDRLRDCVEIARSDYHDVLTCAECPNEFRAEMADHPDADTACEEVERARTQDYEQFRAWLDGLDSTAGVLVCECCSGVGAVCPGSDWLHDRGGWVTLDDSPWMTCRTCDGTGTIAQSVATTS